MTEKKFIQTIWDYYKKNKREMAWRDDPTPYKVVVSEIMLQQTQVERVARKFDSFIMRFPNCESFSSAKINEVLKEWQGLGYNRRALNLHRTIQQTKGVIPKTYEKLIELPGIGPNTAGSILAFAFNIPYPFIETNIRTIYIHFFFKNTRGRVDDKKLMPLIEKTLDKKNPREWYYALMDYGAMLKKTQINPSRRSKHHVKQSKFKGSNRELRSHILKEVLKKPQTIESLIKLFSDRDTVMVDMNVKNLEKEGFISRKKSIYTITNS